MIRWSLLLVCLLGICTVLPGQMQTLEAGAWVGFSMYLGDLQQVRFELDEAHPAFGGFMRYRPSPAFALKVHYYQGRISGSDANYDGLAVRQRNLSFRSPLLELGLQGELALAQFGERESFRAAPYLFLGVGLFYFNPEARIDGRWVPLQPLGTEGQGLPEYPDREPYSLIQVSIPVGTGFQIAIAQKVYMGFELGFRKTFTDYLDDISSTYPDLDLLASRNPMAAELSFRSPEYLGEDLPLPSGQQRGDPETLDFYFFGGFTVSTVIQRWLPSSRKTLKRHFKAQF